jgi:hypothetical protein
MTGNSLHMQWPLTSQLSILWLFGVFSPVLVCCTNKNLATLHVIDCRKNTFVSAKGLEMSSLENNALTKNVLWRLIK